MGGISETNLDVVRQATEGLNRGGFDALLGALDPETGQTVVTICREVGAGAGSGVPVERRTGWIHTLRAGKIVRSEIFLDPADALEAAGLSDKL